MGGRQFFDCPVNLLTPELKSYVRMGQYQRGGTAWFSGGVGTWPARALRAMEIVSAELADLEESKRERNDRFGRTAAGRGMK